MKPNWEDAPGWADYLAMDKDGMWYWYSNKPEINVNHCMFVSQHTAKEVKTKCDLDWIKTLEKRPE